MISASVVSRSVPFDPAGTSLTSRNVQDVILEILQNQSGTPVIALETFIIDEQSLADGFIELTTTHLIENSLTVFVGRLAAFLGEDFTLTSNPETANLRLTFSGNFASDQPEAPSLGEKIRVTYWTIA